MTSIKITKLELNNFKSYGVEVIENLNDKMNIFVGKNGHGKSNIHHGKTFLFSHQIWLWVLNIDPL